MGVMGAAIATSLSQISAGVLSIWYFTANKRSMLKIHFSKILEMPDINIVRETFAIGASSFARQVASSVMTIALNNALNRFG